MRLRKAGRPRARELQALFRRDGEASAHKPLSHSSLDLTPVALPLLVMGDPINVSLPCLDPLETITVAGGQIHIHRLANVNHSGASQPMAMLLLYDLRTILSEPNVSEQAALSRITKLQKRFYSMDELGLNLTSCANSTYKNKNELPETVIKQLKTSSKANGLWFVTVDAALKIAFKFCTPQDAIRISLDLSPFLVGTYLVESSLMT